MEVAEEVMAALEAVEKVEAMAVTMGEVPMEEAVPMEGLDATVAVEAVVATEAEGGVVMAEMV